MDPEGWADLPGVTFTGFVDDLAPYFENALMLAPIRIGGDQNEHPSRFEERFAVFGHGVSFEGIDPVADESALVRETPESYTDVILELDVSAPSEAWCILQGVEK